MNVACHNFQGTTWQSTIHMFTLRTCCLSAQFLIICDGRMQCRSMAHFCWQNCQKKCISMNDMFLPVSDHAGWWIQGAESPGCQKTHPEDDGWEGKTLFFPLLKYLNNNMQYVFCMFSFFVFLNVGSVPIYHRVKPWSTWSQKNRLCHGPLMSVWWPCATSGECHVNSDHNNHCTIKPGEEMFCINWVWKNKACMCL